MDATAQRELLVRTMDEEQLSVGDLWLQTFALAGAVSEDDLSLYLEDELTLPQLQRDLIDMAARELIEEESARWAGVWRRLI